MLGSKTFNDDYVTTVYVYLIRLTRDCVAGKIDLSGGGEGGGADYSALCKVVSPRNFRGMSPPTPQTANIYTCLILTRLAPPTIGLLRLV